MSPKITVLESSLDNEAEATYLFRLLEAYMTDPMGSSEPLSREQQQLLLEQLQKHPKKMILFIFCEGNFAGGAVCFEAIATFIAKPSINIHDFCILPEFRGQGLGSKLMNAIQTAAQARGAGKLTLEVREDNTVAQNLYISQGFVKTSPKMEFMVRFLD